MIHRAELLGAKAESKTEKIQKESHAGGFFKAKIPRFTVARAVASWNRN